MAVSDMAANPHSVSLQNPGETECNTLTIAAIDITIPLQEDLDCDPLQDDEIRIQSLAGGYEKIVRASDADAVPNHDHAMIHYKFRAVPAGLYKISVRIHGHWVDVSNQLIVTPKGAWLDTTKLTAEPGPPRLRPRTLTSPPPRTLPPVAPRLMPRYPDQGIDHPPGEE
jgi:hypothetical protein